MSLFAVHEEDANIFMLKFVFSCLICDVNVNVYEHLVQFSFEYHKF